MIEIEQDYDDEGTEDASKDGKNDILNVLAKKCSVLQSYGMSPQYMARRSCEKEKKNDAQNSAAE